MVKGKRINQLGLPVSWNLLTVTEIVGKRNTKYTKLNNLLSNGSKKGVSPLFDSLFSTSPLLKEVDDTGLGGSISIANKKIKNKKTIQ